MFPKCDPELVTQPRMWREPHTHGHTQHPWGQRTLLCHRAVFCAQVLVTWQDQGGETVVPSDLAPWAAAAVQDAAPCCPQWAQQAGLALYAVHTLTFHVTVGTAWWAGSSAGHQSLASGTSRLQVMLSPSIPSAIGAIINLRDGLSVGTCAAQLSSGGAAG